MCRLLQHSRTCTRADATFGKQTVCAAQQQGRSEMQVDIMKMHVCIRGHRGHTYQIS